MKTGEPEGNPVRSSRACPRQGDRPGPTDGEAGRTASAAGTSDREDEESSMKRFLLGALGTLGVGGLPTTVTGNILRTTPEFSYDWSVSPRLWLGVENDGMGFRASWFHFDQSANPVNALATASATPAGTLPLTVATVTAASALG